MATHQSQDAELIRLLSALEANQLSDDGFQRLDALLSLSTKAREVYHKFIALHDDLQNVDFPSLHGVLYGVSAASQSKGVTARGWRNAASLQWMVAGAFALAAMLAAVFVSTSPIKESSLPSVAASTDDAPPRYVATLRNTATARWHSNGNLLVEGTRLLPGVYRLAAGAADFKFDSGGTLTLKGSSELEILDESAAQIRTGSVVFRSDGAGLNFRLTTPYSRLNHFGTEYGVKIGREAEELHVFEGEVHRLIEGASPYQLEAGKAMRFDNDSGMSIALNQGLFEGEGSKAALASDWRRDLIAYEPFSYTGVNALETLLADGGRGWDGQWDLAPDKPQADSGFIGSDQESPVPHLQPWGGYCWGGAHLTAVRLLEKPIRLDEDGLTYFSYRFRFEPKAEIRDTQHSEILIVLRSLPAVDNPLVQDGLRFTAHDAFLVVSRREKFSRVEHKLEPGKDYLFVGKIMAGSVRPDQLLATILPAEGPVGPTEPESWSVVSPTFESDEALRRLTLHIHTDRNDQFVDELRIGRTWQSVTMDRAVQQGYP